MRCSAWRRGSAHCAELLPQLVPLGVPLVLDHMGMPSAPDDPGFAAILHHLRNGDAWLKATLCRLPRDGGLDWLRPLQEAAVEANPARILWGSDWPYVRMQPAPDAGAMLDMFLDWLGDDTLARRILVENPASLFGFDD